MTPDVLTRARELQPMLVEVRRNLHRAPETGLQLPATQAVVESCLEDLPIRLRRGRRLTSLVGRVSGARPGPLVLLRADMDALPILEQTSVPYRSTNGAMHACGHDLHVAMLIGAAHLLHQSRSELDGDVLLAFQPGEEGHDGARLMLHEGLLDVDRPVVGAFGLHVQAVDVPHGTFAGRAGPLMASSDTMSVTIRGRGGHAAYPHRGQDGIAVAALLVSAIQVMVTRLFDAFDPVVVTVGSINGGTTANVMADEVRFDATVRSVSEATRRRVRTALTALCSSVAAPYGLEASVDYTEGYPVTVNDRASIDHVAATVRDLFGDSCYEELPQPRMGSEDFARILQRVPGAFAYLGAATVGAHLDVPGNHSPLAHFDDSVLWRGSALLAEVARRRLDDRGGDVAV